MVDVEKLRALLALATPGPWGRNVWYGSDDGGWAAVGPHLHNTEDEGDDESPDCPAFDRAKADAAFIAAARDALPELLDEVERLRAENAQLNRIADRTEAARDAVGEVLAANGCHCECGCFVDEHDDDCERCLGCRVEMAMSAALAGAVMVEGRNDRPPDPNRARPHVRRGADATAARVRL